MAKTQDRLIVSGSEVQQAVVWTRGRKVTALLAILMPVGLSLLTARFGAADVAMGIVGLCLALGATLLFLTRRGSGGRHRA